MKDSILTVLDSNNPQETNAVIAQLIDWSQAFDRQWPLLGVKSFIYNGVCKSVILGLINYFQNRQTKVKWHSKLSSQRDLPGGGPQGCSLGLLEYDSQTNNNTDFLSEEDKYIVVDDLSMLAVTNPITVGLSSYNLKNYVASDIGIGQSFLTSNNVESQNHMNKISQWTLDNQI